MKQLLTLLFTLFSLNQAFASGKLLLIGGGKRTPDILKKMIQLADGGTILLVPLASEIPDEVVAAIKDEFTALGFEKAVGLACDAKTVDSDLCLKQFATANVVFFTGGDQNRLMNALKGSKALDLIKTRQARDLHLAGTSAGTAIMSEWMLTGSVLAPYQEFDGIRPKMVECKTGFGFVRKMIIDQHFLKRSRQNRLTSAVLDRPELVGVGIDEATAILVNADESFEVIGDSAVMVIDARMASTQIQGSYYKTQNLKIDLLTSGSRYQF